MGYNKMALFHENLRTVGGKEEVNVQKLIK